LEFEFLRYAHGRIAFPLADESLSPFSFYFSVPDLMLLTFPPGVPRGGFPQLFLFGPSVRWFDPRLAAFETFSLCRLSPGHKTCPPFFFFPLDDTKPSVHFFFVRFINPLTHG